MRPLAGGLFVLPAGIEWADLAWIAERVAIIAAVFAIIGILLLHRLAGRSIGFMVAITVLVCSLTSMAGIGVIAGDRQDQRVGEVLDELVIRRLELGGRGQQPAASGGVGAGLRDRPARWRRACDRRAAVDPRARSRGRGVLVPLGFGLGDDRGLGRGRQPGRGAGRTARGARPPARTVRDGSGP